MIYHSAYYDAQLPKEANEAFFFQTCQTFMWIVEEEREERAATESSPATMSYNSSYNSRDEVGGCLCFRCIPESNYAIVQKLGEHSRMIGSGFNFLMWPLEEIPGNGLMSLRVMQLDVDVNTKTMDNVSIRVDVAVQYCVHKTLEGSTAGGQTENGMLLENENVNGAPLFDAFYRLQNRNQIINNYVENVVRGTIPRMNLDDVFQAKDTLNDAIRQQLNERMKTFGYDIRQALVVNLVPDSTVANSMNEIVAQSKMREAASFVADAQKIVQVKSAEAESQAKFLTGKGVAAQRKAIINGLRTTVNEFSKDVRGATSADVMDVLLMTQYFDVLSKMGTGGSGGTLFLPHGPNSIHSLRDSLKDSFNGVK